MNARLRRFLLLCFLNIYHYLFTNCFCACIVGDWRLISAHITSWLMQRSILLLAVQLLALGCSLSRAARVPRHDLDEACLRKSLYAEHTVQGSVVITPNGVFEFIAGGPVVQTDDAVVAWGSFLDSAYTVSNFGQLKIDTSGEFPDAIQTFAAGFLEGYLTAPRIAQNYKNLHTYFNTTMGASLEEPMKWMHRQDDFVRQTCSEDRGFDMTRGAAPRAPEDEDGEIKNTSGKVDSIVVNNDADSSSRNLGSNYPHRLTGRLTNHAAGKNKDESSDAVSNGRFWDATCLAIRQFDGVIAGYQARKAAANGNSAAADKEEIIIPEMPYSHFLFMQSNADLYDVIDMMQPEQRPSWSPGGDAPKDPETAGKKLFHELALSGKCSALVKLAGDLSEIYMGHSTWDSYTAMLRIYKHYNFNLTDLNPASQRIAFSSYPGQIFSDDDFYVLSSKMVLLQTTNKIFNDELFEALTPESVLSWQRVRAANWLASSGDEWTQYLEMENSGTYNNEYMVVDLKKFVPGEDPSPGLLWVVEQIPGMVVRADMTSTLALGYWPAFNVPAFPEIYNASGYPDFISKLEKYGQHFTKVGAMRDRVSFFFSFLLLEWSLKGILFEILPLRVVLQLIIIFTFFLFFIAEYSLAVVSGIPTGVYFQKRSCQRHFFRYDEGTHEIK